FGKHADQDIDQRQSMEFWGDNHTANGQVQRQDGINLSVLTYNVDQDIEQHQSLKSKDDVNGERPKHGHDAVTQTQFGVNVSLLSANGNQSIHQGQSLNNWTG